MCSADEINISAKQQLYKVLHFYFLLSSRHCSYLYVCLQVLCSIATVHVCIMQARSQGGFRVARKPHTRCGRSLTAREPPDRQHVKYAHVFDPRALELFGYNTFYLKKPNKAIRIKLKRPKNCNKNSWGSIPQTLLGSVLNVCAKPRSVHRHCGYTGLGSCPKRFLATRLLCTIYSCMYYTTCSHM